MGGMGGELQRAPLIPRDICDVCQPLATKRHTRVLPSTGSTTIRQAGAANENRSRSNTN